MAGLVDYSILKPELSNALAAGFQQSLDRQQAQAQQERANKLAEIQLRGAQRGEEEALAEREAYKGATELSDVQQRLMQSGLGKQSIALQKQIDEQKAAKLKQATEIHKLVSDSLRGVAALGTRESAQGALANAKAKGLDVSQYEAELAQVPDAQIRQWALSHAAGADKALEQQFVDLGIGTAAGPKYAIGGNPPALPVPQPQAVAAPAAAPVGIPVGIPGQTPPTRAGNNALALPAPGVMGGAMPSAQPYAVPGGGVMYPKSMTPAQQAAEARAQRQLQLSEQAATPEFEQRMAAAKTTGAEQAKSAVAKQQLVKQIELTIPELEAATKKGGLIDQSTGSGAGRAVDVAAGFFGQATPGAIALGKLQPVASMVLMMQPRFEGPQSDKDTQLYKESAGQLANPNLPTEVRRQAGLQVLRLMKERKNQFVTGDMATIGTPVQPSAPSGAGPTVSNW